MSALFSQKPETVKLLQLFGVLLALCGLAAAWHLTPLKSFADPASVLPFMKGLSAGAFGPLQVIAVYVLGGLVMFPIVVLIPVTALIYGPFLGPAYALLGCLASAGLCYVIGRGMGSETVSRIAGSRARAIESRLMQHGFVMVALFRFLPAAPYTVVNLVAGAFRMRFRDYMAGTLVGLLPGVVIMTALEYSVEKTLIKPDAWSVLLLAGTAAVALGATVWAKRRYEKTAAGD
jgi:phospholipase D1/2